jgi:5'-nucleotidase (lipoprotein e(P4) family)
MLVSCRTWTAAPTAVTPHESLDAVLWTRTSGEYIVLTEQAYRLARMQVDEALKPENATWTAALEQVQGYEDLPPAVVLDVDEAVLDTGSFQAQLLSTGERFGPTVWDAWVHQHKGEAIPGAVEFARYAVANGVSLFFVTNRDWELEEATRENLQDLGFPVEADGANLLTKGERPEWEVDKTSRRKFVAESHRVILMIGDDLNDFFSGSQTDPRGRMALARRWKSYWGTRWIMLPNPFYGGWERSLYDFDEDLTRQQILRRKFDALEAPDTPPAVETPGLPHPDQPGT